MMRLLLVLLAAWLAKGLARTLAGWLRRRKNRETLEQQLRAMGGEVHTVSSWQLRAVREQRRETPPPATEPDGPLPFGYKTSWLAVRCDAPETVAAALGCQQLVPASWAEGLSQAGEALFVSPCLSGWVLVIGYSVNEDAALAELGARFPQVQYFCTHRVTEYHRWASYQAGQLVRDYCWSGERGEVLRDAGDWTAGERDLGFAAFPRLEQDWQEAERTPDEEDVLDIAAAWGVDPRFAAGEYPPSLGWLCTEE